MAKIAYNKSSLARQRDQLRLYERLLPSLDLKRRQLTVELTKARAELASEEARLAALPAEAATRLPMVANPEFELDGIVRVLAVHTREQNVVGVRLPVLHEIETETTSYSFLGRPHWFDDLVLELRAIARQVARTRIARERVALLERAVRRITQRVNLFGKVLIPEAKETIRRIRIFLADAERAAVVRSKIFKRKASTHTDPHSPGSAPPATDR